MCKFRHKILAGVLSIAMLCPMLPAATLYAEEMQETVEQSEVVAETPIEESEDTAQISENETSEGTSEPTEETQEVQEENQLLEYLYVERPVVMAGEKQVIVVGLTESASNMELTIENVDTAKEKTLQATLGEDGTYVFEEVFSEKSVSAYRIKTMQVTQEGTTTSYELSDVGIHAFFGVNEEYISSEKSEVLVMDAMGVGESAVDINMISLATEDVVEIQEEVQQALQDASAGVTTTPARARTMNRESGNIVIVLDPGHDESHHRGARGANNTLHEEVLVLKIAEYCKAELETYAGVKVYMTRTTGNCPFPGGTNIDDINRRVQWAKDRGASAFVSIHLNSSGTSSANGAEVFYPAGDTVGRDLARSIQSQLVALGLSNRGAKADEGYAISKAAKRHGFPGLIVEHAFLSNTGDVNNFLTSDAGLRKLGIADATGIAAYYGLNRGGWEQVGSSYKWKYPNGTYATNRWLWIAEGNFYFGADGIMQTGWITANGSKYYANASGYMQTGWVLLEGTYYYMNRDGQMQTGWQKVYDDWYYLGTDGKMQTGWLTLGTRRYYLNRSGQMLTGTYTIEGQSHTFNGDGILQVAQAVQKRGWVFESGAYYYYLNNGNKATRWQKVYDDWYYLGTDGAMQTGWLTLGSRQYYLNRSGHMVTGTHTIEGQRYTFDRYGVLQVALKRGWKFESGTYYYYLNNGNKATGWQKVYDDWYYLGTDGAMQTGWLTLGSRQYYLNRSGHMLTGTHTIEGQRYTFNGDGILQVALKRGWVPESGTYYYYLNDGSKATGWLKVYDDWYYLGTDGAMQTGWLTLGSRQYYLNRSGQMLTGRHTINGEVCAFNSDGILITRGTQNKGWLKLEKHWYYCLDNGGVATGWLKVYDDWYYLREDGRMHIGWLNLGNSRYYFNGSGHRVTGVQVIAGSEYTFDANGILHQKTTIEGATKTTIAQMVRYYKRNGVYPAFYANSDAPTIEDFCRIYYEEATKQGIKAEIAFVQAMLETGFLRFGGDVNIRQYNFAGLGATGNGVPGITFRTVREGIRAQVQHLQAYASTVGEVGLVYPRVHDRYNLVRKGSSPYVEWLGIQENPTPNTGWAAGAGYGERVLNLMRALLAS